MLIKVEKEILKSDIRLYIDRNLFQFTPLITDLTKSHNEKKEESFYIYFEVVRDNEPLPKYMDYIKSGSGKSNFMRLLNISFLHNLHIINKMYLIELKGGVEFKSYEQCRVCK